MTNSCNAVRLSPADLKGLQLLKAFCVAGMVMVHSFYWIATEHGRFSAPPISPFISFVKSSMFIGVLPLLLPFTAGCATHVQWKQNSLHTGILSLKSVLTEVVCLAMLGYLMNFMAGGRYAFQGWNVLQFVALSMLVIALLDWIAGPLGVLAAAGLVLYSNDALHSAIPFDRGPAYIKILLGDPFHYHTWPFLPWFASVAAGWLLVETLARFRNKLAVKCLILGIAVAAVAYSAHSHLLVPRYESNNLIGSLIFICPAAAVIGIAGLGMTLAVIFSWLGSHLTLPRYGPVECLSAGIIWIYIIHMIVGMRLYLNVFPHLDRRAICTMPMQPLSLVLLAGFPIAMLLLSWAVGYFSVRFMQETRLVLHFRKQQPAKVALNLTEDVCV